MKIPKGFLFALIIIFISTLVTVGFSQEDKKESAPQEKTTVNQKPSEKDLKPQEEKKPEEKKSTPSEEAQQKYDYDSFKMLSESQRNVDRAIGILSLVAVFTCGLITLFAIAITLASLTGFLSYRRWAVIKKTVEEDAKYIKEIRQRADKEFSDLRKEIDKKGTPSLPEETTKEFKEKLNEFNRKLEFFELLGLSLKPQDYINRGWDLVYKSNFEFALEAFEKALESEPDNYQAWHGKGYVLGEFERFKEALEAYDKVIELKPDFATAWVNKGVYLRQTGRFKEALEAYDKAIELKPDYALAWTNKGMLLERLERFEEAHEAYEKAIELKPDYAIAWNNRCSLFIKQGNLVDALKACEKAIELEPEYAGAWFNKACCYSLKKDKENALQNLSKAINLDTKYKEEAKEDEDFREYWEDEDFKKITS